MSDRTRTSEARGLMVLVSVECRCCGPGGARISWVDVLALVCIVSATMRMWPTLQCGQVRPQEATDPAEQVAILDTSGESTHQDVVIDVIEEALPINVHHPAVACGSNSRA